MLKFKNLVLMFSLVALVATMAMIEGCSNDESPVESVVTEVGNDNSGDIDIDCFELPESLPSGVSVDDVKILFASKIDVPIEMLIPSVLIDLSNLYSPEEYFIDSSGLHWGHFTKEISSSKTLGGCYRPYGFSIVGRFHFVYWFSYRPPSYDASMAWIPIYAQPYGSNGILVQKRDMCWICGCNPICTLIWTRICAK